MRSWLTLAAFAFTAILVNSAAVHRATDAPIKVSKNTPIARAQSPGAPRGSRAYQYFPTPPEDNLRLSNSPRGDRRDHREMRWKWFDYEEDEDEHNNPSNSVHDDDDEGRVHESTSNNHAVPKDIDATATHVIPWNASSEETPMHLELDTDFDHFDDFDSNASFLDLDQDAHAGNNNNGNPGASHGLEALIENEFVYRHNLDCRQVGPELQQLFVQHITTYPAGDECHFGGLNEGVIVAVKPDTAVFTYRIQLGSGDEQLEIYHGAEEIRIACGFRSVVINMNTMLHSLGSVLPCATGLQLGVREKPADELLGGAMRVVTLTMRPGLSPSSPAILLVIEFYRVSQTPGLRIKLGDYYADARDGSLSLSNLRGIVYLASLRPGVRHFELHLLKARATSR